MRCPAYCSGCDKPSPGKSLGAVLGPVAGRPYCAAGGEPPLAGGAAAPSQTTKPKEKAPLRGSFFVCTLPGLHPGPYRCWLASTGALRHPSAYSLQRVLGPASRWTLRIFYRMHWKISLFSAMIEIIPWRDGENAEMGKTIVPAVFPSAKSRDLCVAFCTDHGASVHRRRAPRPVGKLEKAALLLVPNLKQGVLLCCMPL